MSRGTVGTIRRFDQGLANDLREGGSTYQMATNFDVLTRPHRLIPYRDSEDGGADKPDVGGVFDKKNFCIAFWTPASEWRLFALGATTDGGAIASVAMKALTTGGSQDLSDNDWDTPAANSASSGAFKPELFTYYHNTGKIYGADARYIFAFTPDGSTAWGATERDLTSITAVAEGLVHTDDILYIPWADSTGQWHIAKNDAGTWTNKAQTIPDEFKVNGIFISGEHLGIACAAKSGVGDSVILMWDRDESSTFYSERINMGSGELKLAAEIAGQIVGVSLNANTSTAFKNKVVFRYRSAPGKSRPFKVIRFGTDSTSIQLATAYQIHDNRLHFLLKGTIRGAEREGLWSVGPGETSDKFVVSHERTPNNDTALSSGTLHNFIVVGDFVFMSFTTSSVVTLTKTNDTASYTAKSIYESKKIYGKSPRHNKKLMGVSLLTHPLGSGAQAELFYRINEETAWTKILTHDEDNEIRKSETWESTTDTTLENFKELQFRIESTGGAEPTGIEYIYQEVDDDVIRP